MKYLVISTLVLFLSGMAQAEYMTGTMSDEEVAEVANNRAYPGGLDEDDLEVQSEILEDVLDHKICNLRSEYRTIRIQYNVKLKSCDAVYTKKGIDARLGGGKYMATCEKIFNNVSSNLQKAGWSCQSIVGSGFTIEPWNI